VTWSWFGCGGGFGSGMFGRWVGWVGLEWEFGGCGGGPIGFSGVSVVVLGTVQGCTHAGCLFPTSLRITSPTVERVYSTTTSTNMFPFRSKCCGEEEVQKTPRSLCGKFAFTDSSRLIAGSASQCLLARLTWRSSIDGEYSQSCRYLDAT